MRPAIIVAIVASSSACASGDACGDMRGSMNAEGAGLSGIGGGLIGAGAVGIVDAVYANHKAVENADRAAVDYDPPLAPYLIAGGAVLVGAIVYGAGLVQAFTSGAVVCREPAAEPRAPGVVK